MNGRATGASWMCLLMCTLAAGMACGGNANVGQRSGQAGDSTGLVSGDAGSLRFAVELSSSAEGPVYISVEDAGGQPGWVTVFRGGERIFLRERCEIEDCGSPPAVCGAAIPTVLDVALVADRSIELVWDGVTSALDPAIGCEVRQRAQPGNYLARFCFSAEAELQAGGDPARPSPGRLLRPRCTDVPFGLDDGDVVLRISAPLGL